MFLSGRSQEIDNISFTMGLSDVVRTRIQEDAVIQLDQTEALKLSRMKNCYGYAIVLSVVCSLLTVLRAGTWATFLRMPTVALGVAAVLSETTVKGEPPEATSVGTPTAASGACMKQAMWIVALCYGGYLWFMLFMFAAFMSGHLWA
jgi:hypothetical protein